MIFLKIFFLFLLPALLFFVSVGVNIYMVYRDLAKVLDNFKGSIIVSSYGDIWGGGSLYAKFTLVSIISGGLVFPQKHLRNGTLDPEEFDRLPSAIRFRMRLYIGFLVGSVFCFLLTAMILAVLKETKCC
ncbi:hypothetical protein [Pseudomonas sp. AM4(2022)]|uniref:hypothetical protein n=1 Tax=Pseudomonas sp. AM4(2022) TaxID=2983408 RepID=UPI002E81EDF9|nr:hypothetical protein [Pseudomonas sp. AM4(2022)]